MSADQGYISAKAKCFLETGYHIEKGVLSPAELEKFRAASERMIRIATQNSADILCNYYLPHRVDHGALYDLYQRVPEFRQLAEHEGVLDVIRDIYSRNFYLFENSLVYKPEGAENAVPWHQDFMYMTGDPSKLIVWIPLDDVHLGNGCIHVIPGSHKAGTLPWHRARGETHQKRTNPEFVPTEKAVAVEMTAGSVLCFDQHLLHSSAKVPGDEPRRAYRFAVKDMVNSYTPRGSPIVLSAEDEAVFLKPFHDKASGPIRDFVHKIGHKISRLGDRLSRL